MSKPSSSTFNLGLHRIFSFVNLLKFSSKSFVVSYEFQLISSIYLKSKSSLIIRLDGKTGKYN